LDITSTKPEAGEGDFGFTQWGPLSAGVGTPMKTSVWQYYPSSVQRRRVFI